MELRIGRVTSVPGLPLMADGRRPRVDILHVIGSPYEEPVLFTGELHRDCAAVLDVLEGEIDTAQWNFVSSGDMAGTDREGDTGDPTQEYKRVKATYRKLYFVDGRHDRTGPRAHELRNADGTSCSLQGHWGSLGKARITGVSGILARRNSPGRLTRDAFCEAVRAALSTPDLHTLVTHETPQVQGFRPWIGKRILKDLVQEQPPEVHVFGRCRLSPAVLKNETITYLNPSGRVLLLYPAAGGDG
jgi:hypothetical protein